MDTGELWRFLPLGYLLTIGIEAPFLLLGVSARHSWRTRIVAALWLTACTYPIVVLVLPLLPGLDLSQAPRWRYLLVAETFAPLAECGLFWLAYGGENSRRETVRDCAAIIAANLASFAAGEWGWAGALNMN